MEKYVKVPIFPLTKYMTPKEKERKKLPVPMIPVAFMFGDNKVRVSVLYCDRAVSRKVGGRGFRYECRASWCSDDIERTKDSVLWYDDFLQEWFVEVPKSRVPVDWDMPTKLSDVGDFYD